MSASLGFSVSTSSTYGERKTCNIPAGTVGQIWARLQVAWAGLYKVQVFCGGHDPQPGDYYSVAPVTGGDLARLETGCSTGWDSVWCEYNYGRSGNWFN